MKLWAVLQTLLSLNKYLQSQSPSSSPGFMALPNLKGNNYATSHNIVFDTLIIVINIFHTIFKYEGPWQKYVLNVKCDTRTSKLQLKLRSIRKEVYQNHYTTKYIKRNPLMKVEDQVIKQEIRIKVKKV